MARTLYKNIKMLVINFDPVPSLTETIMTIIMLRLIINDKKQN